MSGGKSYLEATSRIERESKVYRWWYWAEWFSSRHSRQLLVRFGSLIAMFNTRPVQARHSRGQWLLWRCWVCWHFPLSFLLVWWMGRCGCWWQNTCWWKGWVHLLFESKGYQWVLCATPGEGLFKVEWLLCVYGGGTSLRCYDWLDW